MVGAGGAAAGALEALTRAGARVRLVARRPAVARAVRRRLPAKQQARVTVAAWTGATLAGALDGADVLVSAVPAAAWAEAERARRPRRARARRRRPGDGLRRDDAAGRGDAGAHDARYADGLGMLVHQAARAIELALGREAAAAPAVRAARRAP